MDLLSLNQMQTSRGTIVRLTKLTESSLIVHWVTSEHGLLKTVAQGARRSRSAFAGRLDLFLEAEIEWRESRTSELHQLSEISVLDHRFDLRKSYRKALVAGYFGQLVEKVLEPDHPEPEIYHLLQRALSWLIKEEGSARGLFYFENELSGLLGIGNQGFKGISEAYDCLPKCRDHCLDLLK